MTRRAQDDQEDVVAWVARRARERFPRASPPDAPGDFGLRLAAIRAQIAQVRERLRAFEGEWPMMTLFTELLMELRTLNARLAQLAPRAAGRAAGPPGLGSPRQLLHAMTHAITPGELVRALVAAGHGGFAELAASRFVLTVAAGGSDTLALTVPPNRVAVAVGPFRVYLDLHDAAILGTVRLDGVPIAENYAATADLDLPNAGLAVVQQSFELQVLNGTASPVEVTTEMHVATVERSVYEEVWHPLLLHGFHGLAETAEQLPG